MNPEGRDYNIPTQSIASVRNLIPVQGYYDGQHAVYKSIPQRFSLADIVLFHPDVNDTITIPYLDGIYELIGQLPSGESISSECSERVVQLSSCASFNCDQFSNLKCWITDFSGDNMPDFSERTVAIGIGRIILHGATCYSLLPMCSAASGYATLCRLIEELLMIAVLFKKKRPQASACSHNIALHLLKTGTEQYGSHVWPGVKISLLAHLDRRRSAPMAPQELPNMMEEVANQIVKLEALS